jgi:hypothetical protein
MSDIESTKEAGAAGDGPKVVDLYAPEFLTVMDSNPPRGLARVVLLALVEDRGEGLLTNRIYLIDVVLENGETRSFLQGYAGGGSFTENNFVCEATGEARLLHDFSDAWHDADENVEYDDAIGLAEALAEETIAGFGCNYDGDEPRFSSLEGFAPLPQDDDLHIQYRVWYEKDLLPPGLVEADWGRFQIMLNKSGVTTAVRRSL